MDKNRPSIAITLGDPNGIGPEVILKSLIDTRLLKYVDPLVIGDPEVLRFHAEQIGLTDLAAQLEQHRGSAAGPFRILNPSPETSFRVQFGEITKEAGLLSMHCVEKAIELCRSKDVDAMVTAPISKEAISLAGYSNKGHSGFIAQKTGADAYTMLMVADSLRVGLVTEHIPLWDVPKQMTHEAILEKVEILTSSLIHDFAVNRPRIAVLGLNPHAGDGGYLGNEEHEVILPAIEACCQQGYFVFGPFAADGFFAISNFRNYDAVLAMYHDQGLIPFKTLAFGEGVNYTAGLPIIRTSPDHGTAFNIAGKGRASPDSMRSAIYLALDIVRQRAISYHEP